MSPVKLPTSKTIRLERLYKGAVYKDDFGQLQLPVKSAVESAKIVRTALRDLLPIED
jgi:hypothetical protein